MTPAEMDDAVTRAIDLEDARQQNEFLEKENGRLRAEVEQLRALLATAEGAARMFSDESDRLRHEKAAMREIVRAASMAEKIDLSELRDRARALLAES